MKKKEYCEKVENFFNNLNEVYENKINEIELKK